MSVATDLTIVRNYCSRTSKQTLALADALVRLSIAGQSVRDIVTSVADTAAPLGRNRIALIIKTRKANPDADADAFDVALKAATAANTGARKPAPITSDDTNADTSDGMDVSVAGTPAVPAPVTVTHTLDTLTDRLADLMADARATLTGADLTRFLASVAAEADDAIVTVALPVAA